MGVGIGMCILVIGGIRGYFKEGGRYILGIGGVFKFVEMWVGY